MSVEILLVPAAIAAAVALRKRSDAGYGQRFVTVETRMTDIGLLELALADTEAAVKADELGLSVRWDQITAQFSRDANGLWSAHFDGSADSDTAERLIADLDKAYGLRVQSEVLRRVRAHAEEAGFALEDERVEQDRSVTLTLTIREGAR